jgi:hypothetical protein
MALVPSTLFAKCDGIRIDADVRYADPERGTIPLGSTSFWWTDDLCPVVISPGDSIRIDIYLDGLECHGGFWGSITRNGILTDTLSFPFSVYVPLWITGPGEYRIRGRHFFSPEDVDFRPGDPELRFTVVEEGTALINTCIRGLYLQGIAEVGANSAMRTTLWDSGFIPHVEPYTTMGFQSVESSGATIPSFSLLPSPYPVVDWIRFELYLDQSLSTYITATNALLLSNGIIRSAEYFGTSVLFNVPSGTYFLRVVHRNHLPITFGPLQLNQPAACVNLASTPVSGEDTRVLVGNTYCLRTGNAKLELGPQQISYTGPNNDRDAILQRVGGSDPTATISGYFAEDVNMDGVVKYTGANNDRDVVLQAIGGVAPTAVISE